MWLLKLLLSTQDDFNLWLPVKFQKIPYTFSIRAHNWGRNTKELYHYFENDTIR